MTRQAFMTHLREGLRGLPAQDQADIITDYEQHFSDGEVAGRREEDVAASLGSPRRLALELRAESGLRRWEEDRNPSGAASAIFSLIGIGALDILIALPVLMTVGGTIFGFAIGCLGIFVVGGAVFAAGPFTGMPGGPAAAVLLGIGMMTGAVAISALLAIATIGLVNAVVWFARLHYRLLKPALNPQLIGGAA